MLPLNPSNNQQNCNPISSNCVVWQGADLPHINLYKGDTVSDVVYKMAVELGDLLDQTALSGFDLSCFDPICPKPENFHDLIQFIIDKLCELNNCCSSSTPTGGGTVTPSGATGDCPDCVVTIASCFQYQDQYGNTVTTMNIADYAVAIGSKVCLLSNQVNALQTTVETHSAQIAALQAQFASFVVPTPSVASSCLTPNTNIPITSFASTLETAFCELRTATGLPSELAAAINKQCANLDSSASLANPNTQMGLISGWVQSGSYDTVADAINNMWLTICDLRTAVSNIQTNCCNDSVICSAVSISLTSISLSGRTLTVGFTGSVPTGFTNCSTGNNFTIQDLYGNTYQTSVDPIANLGSTITIDLSSSTIVDWTNLNMSMSVCAENISSNITCNSTVTYNYENIRMCPENNDPDGFQWTFATTTSQIDVSLVNPSATVSSPLTTILYVYIYDSTGTTQVQAPLIYTNSALDPITASFTGLTAATDYKLKFAVQIGNYIKACDFVTVATS